MDKAQVPQGEKTRRGPGRPKGSGRGRSPRVMFSMKVTPEFADRLNAAAAERHISRAAWLKEALDFFLEHDPLSTKNIMKKIQ